MATFWTIVSLALYIYFLFLLARLIVGWVMVFARSWRPSGLVAAGLEVVYAATDPPLKALQRVIPPLNLGTVRLDLGFMVLLIIVYVLRGVAENLAVAS
ncbi:MAG: YggT family protein [Geodermatophilaceae bacterium]|nr:YggT family protein [Geodermatophilaceae bacterium]